MKKVIKRVGNSLGIYFNTEEVKIYGFKNGQVIDIEPVIIKTTLEYEGMNKSPTTYNSKKKKREK